MSTSAPASARLACVDHNYDFSDLHDRMQDYINKEILACCSTLIMQGTDLLDHRTFGYMDIESKAPLREDAIYRMYSNTKIVTSVALMMLYEEGRFALDDPLEKYIPAFGNVKVLSPDASGATDVQEAQSAILVKHILSHSAGLSYGFIEPESVIDQAYNNGGLNVLTDFSIDLEEFTDRVAKLPLAYHPGTSWRYSVATDICARLIEVLSGQSFGDFLQQRIFAPLAMVDTAFEVAPEKADRFITMYAPTDLFNPMDPGKVMADDPRTGQYNQPRRLQSGGGGLVSTMADYLTFLRMITAGGSWDGAQILKPETLQLMRTNQLADGVQVAFPMWAMPGTVFGLGFALRDTVVDGDPQAAKDEYFWGGMAGTHSWMSPNACDGTGITGMCSTQRMPGFWHPFSHEFRNLAYSLTGNT